MTWRGHQIKETLSGWVYVDTEVPCYEVRECGFCGKENTHDGHDGCLGTLPNVSNACCGHGVTDEAYIQFDDGSHLDGRSAVNYFNNNLTP